MSSISSIQQHLSPESQYGQISSINYSESIAKNESRSKFYDVAAKAATIGVALLVLGAVAGTAAGVLILSGGNVALAALAGSVALFIGYGIYRSCFEGVIRAQGSEQKHGIRHWKELSMGHKERAETEKTMANFAAKFESQNRSPEDARVMGRYQHWLNVSSEKQAEVQSLKERIDTVRQSVLKQRRVNNDSSADVNALQNLSRDLYQIEVTQLAPAKIQAAYLYHIFVNREETRPLDELVLPMTKNYVDHLLLEGQKLQTPLASIPSKGKVLTVEEVEETEIKTLAMELFSRQESVA